MLAIAVEFLTGRYIATAAHHRDSAEWPPHPARLFSALVATWADAENQDDEERAVAEWLETLPPPEIHASAADERTALTNFVPTNDASVLGLSLQERRYGRLHAHLDGLDRALDQAGGDLSSSKVVRAQARIDKVRDVEEQARTVGSTPLAAARALLPESRGRQPRTYPSVTPHEGTVVFAWPDADLDDPRRRILDGLLERVVRLGHSSSFVACRLIDGPADPPRFVAGGHGHLDLRAIGPGQLAALERAFVRHQGSGPRSLPHRSARYSDRLRQDAAEPAPARSVLSGELIVFRRTSGTRLPIPATVAAARALRGALIQQADDPVAKELSGHEPVAAGAPLRPTQQPHAAFVALPFTGSAYATGRLMGMGVLLPHELGDSPRRAILRAIGRWEQAHGRGDLPLRLGGEGVMRVARIVGRPEARNLQPETWARPSATWGTVTPIALDRHPGDLWGNKPERVAEAYERAEEAVRQACHNVGLPQPVAVAITLQPVVVGSRPARSFPRFRQGQGKRQVQRALVHARITFADKVAGPLLLSAGRYLGLGLLRPLDNAGGE